MFNSTIHCSNDTKFGLPWPAVPTGVTVTLPCCSASNQCGKNNATRICLNNGQWSNVQLDADCISTQTQYLQSLLTKAMSGGDPSILNELSKQTLNVIDSGSELTSGDIEFLTELISQIVHLVNNQTHAETLTVKLISKTAIFYSLNRLSLKVSVD
jgi:hypothetical protein